ncbi:MAG: glycosyltransferase [Chloroflexota bacterium]|nr:glycosyltransferase [Chloroflexota bacterium]
MTRTRVVRIITRLNVGGPAIQALLLTEHLDPERYESHLIAGRPGPREGDMTAFRGGAVRPIYLGSLGREISPPSDAATLVRLVVLLRRLRPDIVHTHLAKAGFVGRVAARLAATRVVIHTFHGNVLRGYFGPARTRLFLSLERYLARISDRIVSISPRQTAELLSLRIAPREKLVEIPLGLDLAPFIAPSPSGLRSELGLGDESPLVGIVARLVPVKGVDVFLRAAWRIHATRPDTRFVVVGDGELRDELEELAREIGVAPVVTFTGWRADLAPVYHDLDVVVLTSHNEGTPVTLIEAAAAQRPVVATAVGGVPDVIDGQSGLLVPDGDIDALSRSVIRLLEDRALARTLAAAARARVYPRYDRSELLARIDALYCGSIAR